MILQGCAGPGAERQFLVGDSPALSYYKDAASAIEYPVESEPQAADADLFNAPRHIESLDQVENVELSLDDCVRMALEQSTIVRDDASFGSPSNPLLSRPNQTASIYDSAIQNTGFLFGNRGVEAALSDFDALLTTNMTWGRSEDPQNSTTTVPFGTNSLVSDTAAFSTRIEKPLANSGTVSVQHDWNYDSSNGTFRRFPSVYTGFMQAEYRQPLLAGFGTEFTRTAGPVNQSLRGVSGVSQGVVISRINSDISLIDFEQSVTSMVRDVEQRYWDLYLMLRLYDSEIEAFKDMVRYFGQLQGRREGADTRAQARSRLYESESRIKGSLADVLDAEARLRRLVGLPLNDGTFIFPADIPSEAKLLPKWESALTTALAQRPELRRQKWEIRSLELQLKAARNLARPRFDFVSQYRVNALGDNLLGQNGPQADAYESLTRGGDTTWNLGFQFSLPLGLRLAMSQVRNYELRLRKARAALGEQEREIAFELQAAFLNMDRWYTLADGTTKRIDAAEEYLDLSERKLNLAQVKSPELLNLLLQAKIQQRDAQQAYLRSVVEYNKAITDVNFRRGTLLTTNSIRLAEGNWHPAANRFALERAEDRTHAFDNHHLRTEPIEFVAGPADNSFEATGIQGRPTDPGLLDSMQPVPGIQGPTPVMPVPDVPATEPGTPVPETRPDLPEIPEPPPAGERPIITSVKRALRTVSGIAGEARTDATKLKQTVFNRSAGRTSLDPSAAE
jgi:outer membrane protein TolC